MPSYESDGDGLVKHEYTARDSWVILVHLAVQVLKFPLIATQR
jgi:hypothetical protein